MSYISMNLSMHIQRIVVKIITGLYYKTISLYFWPLTAFTIHVTFTHSNEDGRGCYWNSPLGTIWSQGLTQGHFYTKGQKTDPPTLWVRDDGLCFWATAAPHTKGVTLDSCKTWFYYCYFYHSNKIKMRIHLFLVLKPFLILKFL